MDADTYLATYPGSAKSNPDRLRDPAFRASICDRLHPTPATRFLPLVRDVFRREIDYRCDATTDGEYFENLYWSALFLYQIGDLEDVLPMWRAKHINMDTGVGFDVQFLVGRGVAETIEYLRKQDDSEAVGAADYIASCRDGGDFDALDEWFAHRIEYFG